jgi:hypothetical protein
MLALIRREALLHKLPTKNVDDICNQEGVQKISRGKQQLKKPHYAEHGLTCTTKTLQKNPCWQSRILDKMAHQGKL